MSTSLISLADLSPAEIECIKRLAQTFVQDPASAEGKLRTKTIGLLFAVSSTRTRTAFWRAALDMSANVMSLSADDLQLKTGENFPDTGRILANVVDTLVVRTNSEDSDLRSLSAFHPSVINAMSKKEHPTQAISDYATIFEHFNQVDGLRLHYFGEGNSTANALALLFATVPNATLTFFVPHAYPLDASLLAQADEISRTTNAAIVQAHELPATMPPADVVYTTRWQTMGVPHSDEDWKSAFIPFRVDAALYHKCALPHTVFMHDLPAVRGDEVSPETLDGPRSIAWRQAFHKITGAKASLAWANDSGNHT